MISATPVTVGTTPAILALPTAQSVTLVNGPTAFQLGTTASVSATNGVTVPANAVLSLGTVTGSLYGVVASGTATVGVIVSTPR